MPDGDYELGGQQVVVADRVARLARNGSIAGSTLTMDVALRNAVAPASRSRTRRRWPRPPRPGCSAWTTRSARWRPGLRADLVVLDADLAVKRVMRSGVWVR
jgi:N-acetylglucosamine-6-phosphate deacetylase